MTDVLFTHSYFLRFDPKQEEAMMPYPPLGTLYAASYVRHQGYSVALFDSMLATTENDLLLSIRSHHPRVLVIYDDDFNYLTKMCLSRMREAAFRMSSLAKSEGCTVIVHGSDPIDHLADYFEHDADVVICGEGEQTLLETLTLILHNEGNRGEIAGIAYIDDGAIKRNRERPVQKNIDLLPFPARDLVDMEQYRDRWLKRHGFFSTNIVTTRGCPFHCNWCAKPVYGQVYNSRSPHNVVSEMEELKRTVHPDHLWFCDDIFGLRPGWVAEFAREVQSRHAVIPFKCLARVDLLLKEDAVRNLKLAGCKAVWVGAESGSQKILDAMEKGTTVQQIYEATSLLKKAGISVGFFLQYGYPGETAEDIDRTLRMVRECDPDEIGISVSYPLPGTPFYEKVRLEMREKTNWVDSQDLAMMFAGTYPPDFYRLLHRVTHKRFRSWKGAASFRRLLQHPTRLHLKELRCMASGLYHATTLPLHNRRLSSFYPDGENGGTGSAQGLPQHLRES